jgi:hypothetical protein
MAQLSYTVGDWTVVSREVDTISTAKNISVPDLDYPVDFSVSSDVPGKVELMNVSGTSLEPVERLKYARSVVPNIYHGLDTLDAEKLAAVKGVRPFIESLFLLSASNSVTGQTVVVPQRWQTSVETTTMNLMTAQALLWGMLRHFSALMGTGSVDASLLVRLFRGDLDPTK